MSSLRHIGAALLLLAFLVSFLAAVAGWHHAVQQERGTILAGASTEHPLGTDALGRDRCARLGMATLLSLSLSSAAALLSTFLAAIVGTAAGMAHSAIRNALLRVCDLVTTLPWIFLIMIVRGTLPLDTPPVVTTLSTYLLLACLGWSACARVVCGAVVSIRSSQWMAQVRAQGTSGLRTFTRHLVPNLKPTLRAQFLITVPAFLIAEVNLGLLGLGTAEPVPSWGSMLRDLENFGSWSTGSRVQLAPLVLLVLVTGSLQLCLLEKGNS